MRSCTVIIPVFNQAALTARCLETLLGRPASVPAGSEPGWPAALSVQLVLVDDASTDTTSAVLAGFGEKLQVVRHPRNLGFAASCNDGASQATGDYVVFLNNDTIPQPGWLEALVTYAEAHPKAAVVGGRLIYPNKTIQHAGVVLCRDRYPRHIYTGFPADHPAVSQSRRYQIVTGACMLVRRELFLGAGGFDAAFRNGFEDVDLCLRLGQLGHEVHYCAECVVEHLESVSPGRFRHDAANVRLYRRRWVKRVRPDDLDFYAEDGLLRLSYEGRYPLIMELSPLLATLHEAQRAREVEKLLQERTRELAEIQRENTRLRVEAAARSHESPELQYQELRRQIRETVEQLVPVGSIVLVTSKGDGALLDLPRHQGWHFPRTEHGAYAGHHPADSEEAIAALEALRGQGAAYLVIPATSLWWLDHYREFRRHLERFCIRLSTREAVCVIFHLGRRTPAPPKTDPLRVPGVPSRLEHRRRSVA
jgi:GT2 family glycosyltransferase